MLPVKKLFHDQEEELQVQEKQEVAFEENRIQHLVKLLIMIVLMYVIIFM